MVEETVLKTAVLKPHRGFDSLMNKGGYHTDNNDPVGDLEADIKDHRNKSLVFAFFSTHLYEEDYNLDESALIRLEILKR